MKRGKRKGISIVVKGKDLLSSINRQSRSRDRLTDFEIDDKVIEKVITTARERLS